MSSGCFLRPCRQASVLAVAVALLLVPLTAVPSHGSGHNLTVLNTNDSGVGSLRQAILNANGSAGLSTIVFNIPGTGPHTIKPASALPEITEPVVIDGYSQPGAEENTRAVGSNARLQIELDGTDAGALASGLRITAGGSTVRGLVINRFGDLGGTGIEMSSKGGNVVEGNYIGTDPAGSAALPNDSNGVRVTNSPNNRIGGTAPAARNVISGNGSSGVRIDQPASTGNVIEGNLLGTNAAGTAALPNHFGVLIGGSAGGNTVGGTAAGAGNVISGNGSSGAVIDEPGTAGNVVQGNLIGTNAAGTAALPNGHHGVNVFLASNNLVGGTDPGAGNVISGNGAAGVQINSVPQLPSTGNVVQGNLIGTNAAGTAALPNLWSGVGIEGATSGNVVGGNTAAAGNVISGNPVGVWVRGAEATGNRIEGNLIGTNAMGESAVPNGGHGVLIDDAPDNVIGGTDPGAGNVIAGNSGNGVMIEGADATGTLLQGNVIGTNPAGATALGNAESGVVISDVSDTVVGGTQPGSGNVIARNVLSGVVIAGGSANPVLGNAIFDNGGLGIDLVGGDEDAHGVTANDLKDADTGPNNLQNFPLLTEAAVGSTTVEGSLHSVPNSSYRVEFFASPACDSSGHGEGRDFLGALEVATDPEGDAAFAATLPVTADVPLATATATRLVGGAPTDTSEFSNCVEIEGVPEPQPGGACPPDEVPPSGFTDVAGNVHEAAIDCVAWHGIAQGLTPQTYGPAQAVRRDQMASFIARTLETAGWVFPPATDQGFGDIGGNVHADRINQLAEAGVVQGVSATSYAPALPVRRDQMASFLVRAYELVAGGLPPPPPSGFTDTAGNVHETNIDKAAAAGFALGTTPTTYQPAASVRRDQMASFLTRVLERLAADGHL